MKRLLAVFALLAGSAWAQGPNFVPPTYLLASTTNGSTINWVPAGGSGQGPSFVPPVVLAACVINPAVAVTVSNIGYCQFPSASSTNAWTAEQTFSSAGAASSPSVNITGAPYAGTSANSFGSLNIAWGTTPATSALNPNGTALTMQAPTGYTGDFVSGLSGGGYKFKIDQYGDFITAASILATGYVSAAYYNAATLYSASGTALPTCNSILQGTTGVVQDATSPTYMGAYASGGHVTAAVICSYNGSTYSWLTH
jgi:hypothetical protein